MYGQITITRGPELNLSSGSLAQLGIFTCVISQNDGKTSIQISERCFAVNLYVTCQNEAK